MKKEQLFIQISIIISISVKTFLCFRFGFRRRSISRPPRRPVGRTAFDVSAPRIWMFCCFRFPTILAEKYDIRWSSTNNLDRCCLTCSKSIDSIGKYSVRCEYFSSAEGPQPVAHRCWLWLMSHRRSRLYNSIE